MFSLPPRWRQTWRRCGFSFAAALIFTPFLDAAAPKKATKKKPVPVNEEETLPLPKAGATPQPKRNAEAGESTAVSNATIRPETLLEFEAQPARVQKLIESALALTAQNLSYTYGSDDPANGGMDCSGFIHHVLRKAGVSDVPRDASGQYVWVRKAGLFRAVLSHAASTFELDELKPGDLLFWSGTYVTDHDPPITHSMLYLGTEKDGRSRVMAGSSDGRSYHGQSRHGVSVFDFKMPKPDSENAEKHAVFAGYARIPGLREDPAAREEKETARKSPKSGSVEKTAPKKPAEPPVSPAKKKKTLPRKTDDRERN